MFNMKVVERGDGGDSRGPEKIVIPAVFQVFTFKSIPIKNLMRRWSDLFTRDNKTKFEIFIKRLSKFLTCSALFQGGE